MNNPVRKFTMEAMNETSAAPIRRSTLADLRTLPPTISLPTAARFFRLSRAQAYALNLAGEFPCQVLRIGERFHVRTADLARALGVDPAELLRAES